MAIAFGTITAFSQSTNSLSDPEVQGRDLARSLADAKPTTNFNQNGVVIIRRDGISTNLAFKSATSVGKEQWNTRYVVSATGGGTEWLTISHFENSTNNYELYRCLGGGWDGNCTQGMTLPVTGATPFAESDFWVCDLGLDFLHWPAQKIVKKEFSRGRGCMVLESTNPTPTKGYSKVDCWIDEETLGIVHAEAFDVAGKKLKEFDPKSFKKVNGQWLLEGMEIRNVQTGSRTTIRFDLKAN